jgi:ribonucleoside-diphosphate reductase alpha chain
MDAFNSQTHTILQGGRRGANMGILMLYHPDIFQYLEAKSYDEEKLIHFNLSIMVDDDFMKAKNNNEEIWLHYPCMTSDGQLIKDESQWIIKKKVKALDLWNLIMKKAYDTGEYGVFFYENLNLDNNLWYIENITGTNPLT